ncbi:MAG: PLP-dependent aminotransferase family protein [Pseudomonadota bacterium]
MSKPYARIADRIARRIASGELPLGARLPPQRRFAFEEGIAVSTASRVYEELRRRGLVVGEVGRGTFVASRFAPLDPALQEPKADGLDLEIVFRLGSEARAQISASTSRFTRSGLPADAVAPPSAQGHPSVRRSLAALLSTRSTAVDPESLLLAGSGKEAILAALSAIAPRGGRIAVETLTYPFIVSAARLLGIELVPLAVDDEGVVPDALERAAVKGLSGVYLQPTLQSPLVLTMSQNRRRAIAEIITRNELVGVEDRVYSFLRNATPLASYAPNHIVQVDSLSKRMMPGLSVGILAVPPRLLADVALSLRAGGWLAPSLGVALAGHWIDEGVVETVQEAKRQEAAAMYAVVKETWRGLEFRAAKDALHGWLMLPRGWRADDFVAASAELGIAVAPGRAFAVTPGSAPAGVRIAFSTPDLGTWRFALEELCGVAQRSPPR